MLAGPRQRCRRGHLRSHFLGSFPEAYAARLLRYIDWLPLSRGHLDEYLRMPTRDQRHADFVARDRNRNGVLTRDEWHEDVRTYLAMDVNRDGRVTRDEFFLQ